MILRGRDDLVRHVDCSCRGRHGQQQNERNPRRSCGPGMRCSPRTPCLQCIHGLFSFDNNAHLRQKKGVNTMRTVNTSSLPSIMTKLRYHFM